MFFVQVCAQFGTWEFLANTTRIRRATFCLVANVLGSTVTICVIMKSKHTDIMYKMKLEFQKGQ